MNTPVKILVIRNDKIGDFMLAWPAFNLLKKQYPEAEITALVPKYTAELAAQCEWIDQVLVDTRKKPFYKDIHCLYKNIKRNNYDYSISLYSQTRTSLALFLAGVKTRIGPATKIARLFLNRKLSQKRSQSLKPEYEYNLDLVRYFIQLQNDQAVEPGKPPFLSFSSSETEQIKNNLRVQYQIPENARLIFIHPGTGGSAINLSITQYAELAEFIARDNACYFIITAGPGESGIANELSGRLDKISHHVHYSADGIIEFCKFISICDVFISGSTGPLHIAAALNNKTAAFYPARQSATALRWQTINSPDRRLGFSPKTYTGKNDMQQIDMHHAASKIIDKFL